MDALLVVDMQNACFEGAERYLARQVIEQINQLAASFRLHQLPVIHIQHEMASGEFEKGSHGWKIIPEIDVAATDHMVAKRCCDAFIETDLLQQLRQDQVSRLFITGCATDFCVDSTIKGAIAARFNVVIPSDGHTTADRPHIGAEALINHFNWNWQNLSTGEATIDVVPAAAAIKLIDTV